MDARGATIYGQATSEKSFEYLKDIDMMLNIHVLRNLNIHKYEYDICMIYHYVQMIMTYECMYTYICLCVIMCVWWNVPFQIRSLAQRDFQMPNRICNGLISLFFCTLWRAHSLEIIVWWSTLYLQYTVCTLWNSMKMYLALLWATGGQAGSSGSAGSSRFLKHLPYECTWWTYGTWQIEISY